MADTLKGQLQTPRLLRERLTTWDSKLNPKAPLSEKQKDGILELTTNSANRPLPLNLPEEKYSTVGTRSRAGKQEEEFHSDNMATLGHDKVENSQQFFSWFTAVEENMVEEDDHQQRKFIEDLQGNKAQCDQVLEQVSLALTFLEELKVKYVTVSRKTNALHEDCENLLEEQAQLVNTAESINSKLAFFKELERISSKLGSPTLSVTGEAFVPLLGRLDECIDYLNKNPQYRESGVYSSRFQQCLSRATGLVKTHVTNILANATQQVLPKKDITSPIDDAFTLFYGKFRTNAPRVKALMEQIEQRTAKNQQYVQLLSDCHAAYVTQRLTLLGRSVTSAVSDLAARHARDHCALVRSGCAFLVHVCEDECQLFYNFFTAYTPQLDGMMENLCNSLYDVLRPLIIQINHLETLAELCAILKVEMMEEHVRNNPEQLAAFENVCSQLLEDVQERLVYRAHIYIRHEILGYSPAQGDLAYPEKLIMMESIAASLQKDGTHVPGIPAGSGGDPAAALPRSASSSSVASAASLEVQGINAAIIGQVDGQPGDSNKQQHLSAQATTSGRQSAGRLPDAGAGGNMPMSPADLHGMWYPTVRRTLVCLSKLYRCIDKGTFQGLSQEALSMCIASLVSASEQITARRKGNVDGELFLIKHLLIIREQIVPFNVDFSVKETGLDFSKLKDAAVQLVQARSKLFALNSNNALLQFLLDGTPQVTETLSDSKKEVDARLKRTCEGFIAKVAALLLGQLPDFLDKAHVILRMRGDPSAPKVSLRTQPFAQPERAQQVVAETYRSLRQHRSDVQRAMALYLANRDTEFILFKPVKVRVQQSFAELHKLLEGEYTEEDRQIIAAPSLEQVNLLLASGHK